MKTCKDCQYWQDKKYDWADCSLLYYFKSETSPSILIVPDTEKYSNSTKEQLLKTHKDFGCIHHKVRR